ncbi:MAG: hypothetical protein WA056_14435 [Gallionella sp.]
MQKSGMGNEYVRYVMAGVAATLIFLLCSSQLVFAGGQSTHPANENEFVGYWRILLIDNNRHKSGIKNEETNYIDPCQFLIHQSDGSWMNISPMIVNGQKATKDNCPTDRAEIDKHIAIAKSISQPFKWSKLKNKNGLFYVADSATNSGLLWKADYVAEDLPVVERIGFELKRGDMIMQLARFLGPTEIAPIWPMVLRPVQQ